MANAARNYNSHIPPHLVKSWIKSHAKMYNVSPASEKRCVAIRDGEGGEAFDLASDCAADLGLFDPKDGGIPEWVTELVAEFVEGKWQ